MKNNNTFDNIKEKRDTIIKLLKKACSSLKNIHTQYAKIKEAIEFFNNKSTNIDLNDYLTIGIVAELLGKDKLAKSLYINVEKLSNDGMGYIYTGALSDNIYEVARRSQHKPVSEEIALQYYLQAANLGNEYGALQMIEWSSLDPNFSFDYYFQDKTRHASVDRDLEKLTNGSFKHAGNWYCAETITNIDEKIKYYKKLLENGYEVARLKIEDLYNHEKKVSPPPLKIALDKNDTSEMYIDKIINNLNNIVKQKVNELQTSNKEVALQELWEKIVTEINTKYGLKFNSTDNYLLIRYGLICEEVGKNCLRKDAAFKKAKKVYQQVIENGFITEGNVRLAMLHIKNNYFFEGMKYLEPFDEMEVRNYLMSRICSECFHYKSLEEFTNKNLSGEQHYLLNLAFSYQIVYDPKMIGVGSYEKNEMPKGFFHIIESAKKNYLRGLEFYHLMHPYEFFMDIQVDEILERYHNHMTEEQYCYRFLEKAYYQKYDTTKSFTYMKKYLELIVEKGDIMNFQDAINLMQEREYPQIEESVQNYVQQLITVLEKEYKISKTPYLLYKLGKTYQFLNTENNYELSRNFLLEGAKLGNEKATLELANLYCSGKLGYRDYNEAIKYYERFQNNPLSLYMLTQIHYCCKHTIFPDKLSKEKAIQFHQRYHTLIQKNALGL